VQKLQAQNLRMHVVEQESRAAAESAAAELEEVQTKLAAAESAGSDSSSGLEYELSLAVATRDEAMAGNAALEAHVAELTSSLEAALDAPSPSPSSSGPSSEEVAALRLELEEAHAQIASLEELASKPGQDAAVDSMASTLEMSLLLLKSSWIDLAFREMDFRAIVDEGVDILAGVGGKTSEILQSQLGVSTVRDLATLPAYINALAVDPTDSDANKQPVSTLLDSSLSPELRKQQVDGLAALRIRTVGDMRSYKFAMWAAAILELAPSEQRFTMHLN
jgi:hypothetical protein